MKKKWNFKGVLPVIIAGVFALTLTVTILIIPAKLEKRIDQLEAEIVFLRECEDKLEEVNSFPWYDSSLYRRWCGMNLMSFVYFHSNKWHKDGSYCLTFDILEEELEGFIDPFELFTPID